MRAKTKKIWSRLNKPTPPFFKRVGNALAATFGAGGVLAGYTDLGFKIIIGCFVLAAIGKFLTEFAVDKDKNIS